MEANGAFVIVGCGYVGTRLAEAARQRAHVTAFVRTQTSAVQLRSLGLTSFAADFDGAMPVLPSVVGAWLYYFVPPPSTGKKDARIRKFLSALDSENEPAGLVLLSTTGVYGDCGGAWVDESAPVAPRSDRAHRRADAENAVREWAVSRGLPFVILRVPGIYGPGRLPRTRLRDGAAVLREADSPWSNRVHVDDLVAAALAIPARGRSGAIYNVSDGNPSTMTDYFNRVADATGLPHPPQLDLASARRVLKPAMLSYLGESKRIDNRRMRTELGVTPRYSDLDLGLAACLEEEGVCCNSVRALRSGPKAGEIEFQRTKGLSK